MTIEERAEQAAALKQGSCNCCQAVLCALADQTGMDSDTLYTIGSGFGAGMGNMEATCGALVGAAAAAGLHLKGSSGPRTSRQLSENFRARCGATLCRELKGRDTGTVLCPCADCVRNAVRAYGDVVGLEED